MNFNRVIDLVVHCVVFGAVGSYNHFFRQICAKILQRVLWPQPCNLRNFNGTNLSASEKVKDESKSRNNRVSQSTTFAALWRESDFNVTEEPDRRLILHVVNN